MTRARFVLEIEDCPRLARWVTPGPAPADVRLAGLLKALGRGWGFRCVSARELPAGQDGRQDAQDAAGDAPPPAPGDRP